MGKGFWAVPMVASGAVVAAVLGVGHLGTGVAGRAATTTTVAGVAPATSLLPATTTTSTTLPGAPSPPSAVPVVRSAADADEPLCETRVGQPASVDPAGSPPLATLEGVMSVVNTYGVPLGEEFHGAGMTWTDDGRHVVIAAFVANVAEHRDALNELVDPDHLVVCRARLTRSEAAAIVAEIEPLLADAGNVYGPTGMEGLVDADIRAGNEELAESLHDWYPDELAVTLGAFPYPMPDPLPDSRCPDLAVTNADLPYAVEDPAPVLLTAADGLDTPVEVPFVNATSERVVFTTGHPSMYLVDPDSGVIVGVPNANFGHDDVGINVDLEPGERLEQSVHVPTASCDPALGHTVAPGDYHLYAVNSAGHAVDFAVGPVPVTIT